jgi:energy-coupling factor transport system ATP-binding protein
MSGLRVKQVTFTLETMPLLKEISFELEKGQVMGIYGKSGSGKSTLFHLLAGLEENFQSSFTGSIEYDQDPIFQLSPQKRTQHVALMFQNVDTQFCMDTVENELLFCLENINIAIELIAEKINQALRFCEIFHLKNRQLHTLSGGEKQLVALACCYCLDSEFLLLDEPFANLDEASTKMIIKKLQALQRQRHVGMIVIDHQVAPLKDWVEKWFVLVDGKINGQVTSQVLLRDERKIKEALQSQLVSATKASIESTRVAATKLTVVQPAKPVLTEASFQFSVGKMIGITGKSGSGKTTFLKVLAKQYPYHGQIEIGQKNLLKISSRKLFKTTSYIFQNPQDQFIATTVEAELLAASQKNSNLVRQTLAGLGLAKKAQISPFRLSQGQQRRLTVAALLLRPLNLLLVDEPTVGQDIENAYFLMQLLKDKVQKENMTAIVVSHDAELLHSFCEECYELEKGHLVRRENYEEVESNSQSIH